MTDDKWLPWQRIHDTLHIRFKPHRLGDSAEVWWVEWQAAHTSPPEAALTEDTFPLLTSGNLKADGCMDWGGRDGSAPHLCGPNRSIDEMVLMLRSVYRLAHPLFAHPGYEQPDLPGEHDWNDE
jgi:hypothetical protein